MEEKEIYQAPEIDIVKLAFDEIPNSNPLDGPITN